MGEARSVADSGEILTRTVERLSNASELTTITETVAAAARAIAGSDGATFVLREDDRCFYVDEDAIGPLWKGQKFLSVRVHGELRAILIRNSASESPWPAC